MPTERLSKVEDRLSRAMRAQGMTYLNREAVIFYFENDDTDARKDAYVLKGCLEDVFGVMSTIIEISKKDTSPAFTMRDVLSKTYNRMAPARHNLPSLMILGYVGHGAIDSATGMVKFLSADGRQNAQWKYISQQWFSDDPSLENIDSLAILDCCFSGATRQKHARTSQILAACGANETARSRSAGYISFSQIFSSLSLSSGSRTTPFYDRRRNLQQAVPSTTS